MTYPSDAAALDALYAVLHNAWIGNAAGIVGYVPELRWPGNFEDSAPDVTKHWGRVSKQTVMQEKANLSSNGPGGNRYHTDGFLTLQLFAPLTQPGAADEMNLLAEMARNSYRGAQIPGDAFTRNERIREVPNDAKFYRCNVIVEYEYDALGG